jgi:valyl-tRNA synthetase
MADPERTPSSDTPSGYDPRRAEQRWYPLWVERGYFHAEPKGEPFCIVLPPPNITGALHAGHAFNGTIQDMLTRRRRMQGYAALWLPGTDHAGIATQVVVERALAAEGVDRRELGREAFVDRVWAWREEYGDTIIEQFKALGVSADWERLRFTMDEGLSKAVRVAFVTMYDDGLIYRGERIVNWCPRDTTALSDSEVEHEDVDGELVTFRYDLTEDDGHIDVATTRVETMLGDTGIAVHPSDERYSALVGRTVRHPFDGRDLPIVADAAVDPAFGTGAVKVTPAHDPTDFEIGQRAGLPLMNILDANARLTDVVPPEFRGLDRYVARRVVREALAGQGRVVSEVRPFVHPVGHCYRCHTEIEPWIAGLQWFVAVDRLKGPAIQAVEDGRITFAPERWKRNYLQWMEGLRDWNISRQLWWGHRIPVWYCADGHQFASVEDPVACATCGSERIEQDPDALDTWFSSQLWPFSTLGWPEDTADLRFFYPTSVLVTGYEILYLWVARMVMSGMYLMGDIPFHKVVITGLVRDPIGRKMSKSLGNVIDPLDLIRDHGADATRYGLARLATGGQDIPLSVEAIEAGRRFGNKIWNATRLVQGAFDPASQALELPPLERLTLPERWLLSRLETCRDEVDLAIEEFRVADATVAIHRFIWSEFCDWGLEVEKLRLYGGSAEERADAGAVLAWVLERSLRLLHPIMPFVTEEAWQGFDEGESIMIAPWPESHPSHLDEEAERGFAFAQDVVTELRRFRKAHGLADSLPLEATIVADDERAATGRALQSEIAKLAGLGSLDVTANLPDGGGRIRLSAAGVQILVPLAGVLDVDAESVRLSKRLADAQAEQGKAAAKLGNETFVAKAPPDVVAEQHRRLAAAEDEAAAIRAQLEELG